MRPLLLAIVLAGFGFPSAAPADVICRGTIGNETISDDDVVVPPDEACQLEDTIVENNVRVQRGARLTARRAHMAGNLRGEGAARVVVEGSQVGGSIQVEQGGGANVRDTRVEGDIQLFTNSGPLQHVVRNTVGGNIQVVANRGGVDITGNTVDGHLRCQSNDPVPTGGDNAVRGNREAQCAALMPQPAGGGGVGVPALGDRSLRAGQRGRSVSVPLRCGERPCAGRVRIVRRGRTLGSRRYSISAGGRSGVRVHLNARGRRLVRATARLRVVIAITAGPTTVRRGATIR
jgi:hypothetical protein